MKRVFSVLVSCLIVLIMSTVAFASIPSTVYNDYEGNISGIVKIDPPVDTTIYFNEDGSVSDIKTDDYIIFDVSEDGKYLSFVSYNVCIDSLYVKGGNAYRVYEFPEGTTSAEKLQSPINDGGNIPQISHYGLLKFNICKPTETTSTNPSATTTTLTITSTPSSETTTIQESTISTTSTITTNTTTIITPTTTFDEEFPKTGESGGWQIIGFVLLGLATSLYFITKKSFLKSN